jgi:hypothetical protein
MPLTVTLGFSWGALMLLALWWWTQTPAWLKWAGLAFPAYYVGLSLWLEGRRLRR